MKEAENERPRVSSASTRDIYRILPTFGFGKFFFALLRRFLLDICGVSRFFPYNRRRLSRGERDFGKKVLGVIIDIIDKNAAFFLFF